MNTTTIAPETLTQLVGRFDDGDEIQRFISGELVLISAEDAPLPKEIYLTLNCDSFNIEKALNSGNYDEINPHILNANFSVEGKGIQELEFDLFRPNNVLTTGDAIKEMKKDSDPENPWLPARIEHGLLFAAAFSSAQKKHPVVTPGTILQIGTEKLVAYFSSKGTDRRVCLGVYTIEWTNKARLLRYRLRKVYSD